MKYSKNYFAGLSRLFEEIIGTDAKAEVLSIDKAFKVSLSIITERILKGGKVILIGNGGSAAIASHIAVDLLKNCHVPALAFNDASFLTCIGNDLGYEEVFAKPVSMLGNAADVLIAISSSGKSANILKAVDASLMNSMGIVTLSGMSKDNPLRKKGEVNFYVPSSSYGYVEIVHLAICHCIVEKIMQDKRKNG